MEINNNNQVNPSPINTASAIISPEVWASMTPEQRAQYPAEIQQIMNQQMDILAKQAAAATAAGMPTVPPMSTPIPNLTPNQDVVIPPVLTAASPTPAAVNNDEGVKKLSLKEQKELLKNAELGTGCSRDWYEFYKVSFTNQHDISAILAGVAIGVVTVLLIQGAIYLIKKA